MKITHETLIANGFTLHRDSCYYEKFLDCKGEEYYDIDCSFVTLVLQSETEGNVAYARAKCMASVSIGRYVDSIEDIEQLIKDFFEKKKDYETKRSKTDH